MKNITSRQRAYLRGMAQKISPIIQIGKNGVTPDVTQAVSDALEAREIVKISILKNCFDAPMDIADILSERTRSDIVQVIGRKITLYRKAKKEENVKIVLPK